YSIDSSQSQISYAYDFIQDSVEMLRNLRRQNENIRQQNSINEVAENVDIADDGLESGRSEDDNLDVLHNRLAEVYNSADDNSNCIDSIRSYDLFAEMSLLSTHNNQPTSSNFTSEDPFFEDPDYL